MIRLFTMMIVALTIVLAIVPHVVWCLVWLVCKCVGYSIPYAPCGWATIGLILFAWLLLAYGFYIGRWRLQVVPITYENKDIPTAFDGFRIVHISDFHLSTFADNPDQLERFVNTINAQHPDLICFTGDLVSLTLDELTPHVNTLRQLHAPYGVCSVLGNHDFFLYSRQYANEEQKEDAVTELARIQREELGWHLLRNDSYVISKQSETSNLIGNEPLETITILGVDNSNCANQGFHTIHRGDLHKAMQGTSGWRILLSHDPSHWRGEVLPETDIPLTLCGHTHAAQIRILGWTPATWSFVETAGRYDKDGQTLYINIGLGCTAPVRLGANPEITVITLKNK